MSEKIVPFPKLWQDSMSAGRGLEDWAEELYNYMVKKGCPKEEIELIIGVLRELKGLDEYFTETKADKDDVEALRRLLNKHKHVDEKAVIPLEDVDC